MKLFSFNLVLLWVWGSREYRKQQAQTCEGWNLSMVLMMQFLLGSLSPGPGLHGVRNFKPHYLFFLRNPTALRRVHQTSPQFCWEKIKCRTESWLMHSPSQEAEDPDIRHVHPEPFFVFSCSDSHLWWHLQEQSSAGLYPWLTTERVLVAWPWLGKQPEGSVCSHHPSMRYHHFTEVVKGKNVKVPTLLAEVRLVFQHSLPWELALPRGQPRHGTSWKRFSRKVKQSRTEQTEGCVWSQSHGRQGPGWLMCKQPLRPGTSQSVTGAQVRLPGLPAPGAPSDATTVPPQCQLLPWNANRSTTTAPEFAPI